MSGVLELRIALTVDDYERIVALYRDGLGLDPAALWVTGEDRAVLFDLGRATLEIFDEPHAAVVDALEVGQRVSGPIRFAIRVTDVQASAERLAAYGATLVHAPVMTPWGDLNARLRTPDGMQITLFQTIASPD
jgi:catechol 2,3-dioxygenase-like lactoylglutathione lyase family enzyme